jgi:hypothetical protein
MIRLEQQGLSGRLWRKDASLWKKTRGPGDHPSILRIAVRQKMKKTWTPSPVYSRSEGRGFSALHIGMGGSLAARLPADVPQTDSLPLVLDSITLLPSSMSRRIPLHQTLVSPPTNQERKRCPQ